MRCAGSLLALALLALAGCRGAGDSAAPPASFSCRGNEPFWDLEVEGEHAVYRALAEELRERSFAGSLQHMADGPSVRLEWRGTEEAGGGELVAEIVEERCLDTMSDETPPYPYSIRLTLPGGEEVTGCCRGGSTAGE